MHLGRLTSFALVLLTSAACQATLPVKPPSAEADREEVRRRAGPTGLATAAPVGAAASRPEAPRALQRPAEAATLLKGVVLMDAAYLVRAGAGKVVGTAAGDVVAVGAGGLVAAGAGNLVAAGAGELAGGDRARTNASGNLVAAGSLIGLDGAGLIGPDGAGLIGPDGAGYRLRQATPGRPAVGSQLPAAGLLVSLVSLDTYRYLPLGRDPGGRPVYSVYSNARGAYEVWIPTGERYNLALVTSVPGARDERLTHNHVVTPTADQERRHDEIAALTSRYLRYGITGKIVEALRAPELAGPLIAADQHFTRRGRARMLALVKRLSTIAAEEGLTADAPEARLRVAAQRWFDLSISRHDLAALRIDPTYVAVDGLSRADMPVLAALEDSVRTVREGAIKRLSANPDFFDQTYLTTVINADVNGNPSPPLAEDWTGRIVAPSDLAEFLLREYLGRVRPYVTHALRRTFMACLEPTTPDPAQREAEARRLVMQVSAAGYQVTLALADQLLSREGEPSDAASQAFEREVRAIARDAAGR